MFEGTFQMTFATLGMIATLPLRPFHILVTNFFAEKMHLLKHIVVAYDTGPRTSVMTASSTPFRPSLMRTPEIIDRTAFNDVETAPCKASKITA